MEQIKQLDEILGHEAHKYSKEQLQKYLGESKDFSLNCLYRDPTGIKFMLFSDSEENGYLRIQREGDACHDDIIRRLENRGIPIRQDYKLNGGGCVTAKKEGNRTIFNFSGRSTDYGEFDEALLRKVLDEHLDKEHSYEIK